MGAVTGPEGGTGGAADPAVVARLGRMPEVDEREGEPGVAPDDGVESDRQGGVFLAPSDEPGVERSPQVVVAADDDDAAAGPPDVGLLLAQGGDLLGDGDAALDGGGCRSPRQSADQTMGDHPRGFVEGGDRVAEVIGPDVRVGDDQDVAGGPFEAVGDSVCLHPGLAAVAFDYFPAGVLVGVGGPHPSPCPSPVLI